MFYKTAKCETDSRMKGSVHYLFFWKNINLLCKHFTRLNYRHHQDRTKIMFLIGYSTLKSKQLVGHVVKCIKCT